MAAFFTACQPELVSTEPVHQNTINVILDSWQHLEKTQPKVAYNIKQIKQQTQLNRYSSNYNFYINDSTVQVIEQPNYTTFTFFVYRDSITPNILENYTYKLYNDGTYEQFLLKYHYTLDQDLNKVFSETQFDIEAIDDHSLLYGRTNSCVPEFVTVQTGVVCTVATECTGGLGHKVGESGCDCENTPSTCYKAGSMQCNPTYTVVYNNNCGGGGDEPELDPNQNTNTTQGGNTQDPNSDPDPNNNNTIATPLEDPTPVWQGILDCINNPNLLNPDTTTIDSNIFESLGLSKATYQTITNFLDENDCSDAAQEVIIEFLENESSYPHPHCSSFEYSKPPGINIRACAVTNLTETFYAYGEQNGQLGTFVATINYDLVFFTMPTWMTNGQASTKTAIAVEQALKNTKNWFYINYDATEEEILMHLDNSLQQQMTLFGGTKTDIQPFTIPSPAPYQTNLISTGNCN